MNNTHNSLPYDPFESDFKTLVDQNPTTGIRTEFLPGEHAIPRNVYQFWLGNADLPEVYQRCLDHNRTVLTAAGFTHHLITDAHVDDILNSGGGTRFHQVFAAIPPANRACQKDLLAAIMLADQGGFALDCSMYVRSLESLAQTASHCVRYRHYLRPKQRAAVPYALPCLFGFLGARPKDTLFAGVLEGMEAFWLGDDHRRLAEAYTSEAFPHRELKHGWMCQYYINEGVQRLHRNLAISPQPTRISLSWDRHVLDIDCIETAYVIKRLCLGKLNAALFEQHAVRVL